MKRYKGLLALLALFFALPCAAEEFYTKMPPLLCFEQETVSKNLPGDTTVRVTYPDTANDAADEALRAVIDGLAAQGEDDLCAGAELEVGALISRSGESTLSFLVLAETTKDRELLAASYDALVYDMETGEKVTLGDLFEDDAAYALLADEARAALDAAFPAYAADEKALGALCSVDAIREAKFTLGAARMTLTFRADALYPGRNTLLHVNVAYSKLRPYMSDYGLAATDNSRFRMIALTYDDGPNRGATRGVLDVLRRYGAQATFFVVGDRFDKNHDMLAREQNGNYSIQSHTFSHKYPDDLGKDEAMRDKVRMEETLGELIGVVPTMMRAPGGHAAYYAIKEIDYPLIQWNLASGDSGNPHVKKIAQKVIDGASDGDIALMHDLNGGSPTYSDTAIKTLTDKGYLFVTVQELFDDAEIELRKNVAYKNPDVIEYEKQP